MASLSSLKTIVSAGGAGPVRRTVLALASVPAMFSLTLAGCGKGPWNNPWPPVPGGEMVYHSVMHPTPPKHLDSAVAYAQEEALFLSQIVEPPIGYHFLKRPYELTALGAESLPALEYLDAQGQPTDGEGGAVAYTRYTLRIRKDLRFQPHPAFALDEDGKHVYRFEQAAEGETYREISDFLEAGSRPVRADDYAYAIKRLADPLLGSSMLGLMSRHIVGFREYSESLAKLPRETWLNLDDYPMRGLEVTGDRTLRVTIQGRYPQFIYWLAMNFFAPVAPEVDRFYHNPGFDERNLTLDWWPVGTGPYMLVKNDPNSEIVLVRNPNYRVDYYPDHGATGDAEAGYLDDAGRRLPFIDRAVFRLEKQVFPLWTKFWQGYYDRSGEVHGNTNDVFDQTFTIGPDGIRLREEVGTRGIILSTDIKPAVYYFGFNMLDPLLGGYTDDKRKLRQALQIAFNTEEYLAIFFRGNGLAAHSPIPPGIPGHREGREGINPYVYDWANGKYRRKSIEYARDLLAQAGYPGGRDPETGKPLKIHIDVQSQAINTARMQWIQRAFDPLGVQVEFRSADWNRTREKLLTGNTQVFSYGWQADYPDPENFLLQLSGPQSPLECECDGANNANYRNSSFDRLFEQLRAEPPGEGRDNLVARMVELYQRDAVWLFAWFPVDIYLDHGWLRNTKRHGISRGTLKYLRVEEGVRAEKQAEWNRPVTWPLYGIGLLFTAAASAVLFTYRRRQRSTRG